jgi:hypothetical protein
LDSFISPIPGFDGDILIPAIPILNRPPGDEPMSDPSVEASVITLKTRADKQKVTTNLIPLKKAKKTTVIFAGGIKINQPAPNAPASTPPSGP